MSREFSFEIDGKTQKVVLGEAKAGRFAFQLNGRDYDAEIVHLEDQKVLLRLNGRAWEVETNHAAGDRTVWETRIGNSTRHVKTGAGVAIRPVPAPPAARREPQKAPASAVEGAIDAPMPGKILKVHVEAGQQVKKGELILTLEAMKMENRITAHADGVIESVRAKQGMNVAKGECMVVIKSPSK